MSHYKYCRTTKTALYPFELCEALICLTCCMQIVVKQLRMDEASEDSQAINDARPGTIKVGIAIYNIHLPLTHRRQVLQAWPSVATSAPLPAFVVVCNHTK